MSIFGAGGGGLTFFAQQWLPLISGILLTSLLQRWHVPWMNLSPITLRIRMAYKQMIMRREKTLFLPCYRPIHFVKAQSSSICSQSRQKRFHK